MRKSDFIIRGGMVHPSFSGRGPGPQTLLVKTRTHERYYVDQVTGVLSSCLLIQSHNQGTGPAIAYRLTHLLQLDPQWLVAILGLKSARRSGG